MQHGLEASRTFLLLPVVIHLAKLWVQIQKNKDISPMLKQKIIDKAAEHDFLNSSTKRVHENWMPFNTYIQKGQVLTPGFKVVWLGYL